MKTIQQIQNKIDECHLYEYECEQMATCIELVEDPNQFEWKTFHDVNASYKLSANTWMDKSVLYFKIAEALEWVIKD